MSIFYIFIPTAGDNYDHADSNLTSFIQLHFCIVFILTAVLYLKIFSICGQL